MPTPAQGPRAFLFTTRPLSLHISCRVLQHNSFTHNSIMTAFSSAPAPFPLVLWLRLLVCLRAQRLMSGYSADLMAKRRLLSPIDAECFPCMGKHSIVMPCPVLISMHDIQEFSGEHLHKLALSATEAGGWSKRGPLGERSGRVVQKARRGGECSIVW